LAVAPGTGAIWSAGGVGATDCAAPAAVGATGPVGNGAFCASGPSMVIPATTGGAGGGGAAGASAD